VSPVFGEVRGRASIAANWETLFSTFTDLSRSIKLATDGKAPPRCPISAHVLLRLDVGPPEGPTPFALINRFF
jgi:hypothetical protein